MFNAITRSQLFVLDQDQALEFYTNTLGLDVVADIDLGFMRWLTVCVPGDPAARDPPGETGPTGDEPEPLTRSASSVARARWRAGSASRPTTPTARSRP